LFLESSSNLFNTLNENHIENIELTEGVKRLLDQRLNEPESEYYSVDEMLKRQNERF